MENLSKTIYPKFNIMPDHNNPNRMDLVTYVRKQRKKDGVWFLIPIRTQYEMGDVSHTTYESMIKDFGETCYRVLMLYKLDNAENIVDGNRPWIRLAERDNNQQGEQYRLNRYLNFNVKVL